MKLLNSLILSFSLAIFTFFVVKIYAGLNIEVSTFLALLVFVIIGGISLIGFDKFIKTFEGKSKTEGMTQEQIDAYQRKKAELQAQKDFEEEEGKRNRPYKNPFGVSPEMENIMGLHPKRRRGRR